VVTIKSSRDIDAVFSSGRRYATPLFVALIVHTPEGRDPSGRVAFVAGKKLGGAVTRNRCKRVMRAAAARVGGPWPSHDVVLIARTGVRTAPALEIDDALRGVLTKAGIKSA